MQAYLSHEKGRTRQREQQVAYTSRRGEDGVGGSVEKREAAATMIRRKSISGHLKKKVREQAVHHLSSASPA